MQREGLVLVASWRRISQHSVTVFSPITAHLFGAIVIVVAVLLAALFFYLRRAIMQEQAAAALLRDEPRDDRRG
jgi:uncharacterized membrane protein YqiK